MSFLAPLFFAALAALGVPVLIHMIQRQRTEVIEFPSLMFVRKIPFHSLRRQRIRHWLLLLLRCAALALLIAAFARPFFARSGDSRRPVLQHGIRRPVGAGAGRRARRGARPGPGRPGQHHLLRQRGGVGGTLYNRPGQSGGRHQRRGAQRRYDALWPRVAARAGDSRGLGRAAARGDPHQRLPASRGRQRGEHAAAAGNRADAGVGGG